MKPIKITADNAAAINAALDAVNGKAHTHTFSRYSEIEALAKSAEAALDDALLPKKDRAGAIYTATSGDSVANAYKYSRTGTRVRLERRSSAWYLVEVESTTLYAEGGRERLTLTAEQAKVAVEHFSRRFNVAAAPAL